MSASRQKEVKMLEADVLSGTLVPDKIELTIRAEERLNQTNKKASQNDGKTIHQLDWARILCLVIDLAFLLS